MKKKRERDWLPVTVLLLTVLLLVLCLVGFDHHEPDWTRRKWKSGGIGAVG